MTDKALQKFNNNEFRNNLVKWYNDHKRTLPWRETNDPYAIWVSEVMLQQTKVETVISYYKQFMNRYPTIFDLARANEQEVLKEWEGLGYYSRARNLHEAAKEVVISYGGQVPNDQELLGKLKGIGPYTKGAILSIAFNQPVPAVDGNVMRVLSRVLLIEDNISEQRVRRRFEKIVEDLICHNDPSSFNQGLMELGALICTPRSPACLLCPVQTECRAFEKGKMDKLPIKFKNKKQKKVPYVVLLIYDSKDNVAIEQRPSEGLLANMWQFPMFEKDIVKDGQLHAKIKKQFGIEVKIGERLGQVNHVFSHLIWELTIFEAFCQNRRELKKLSFLPQKELKKYPFSVSHLKIMEFLRR